MSADPATVAGIALAIPGIIDLCIKYAGFLTEKYESAKGHKRQIGTSLVTLKSKLTNIVAQLGTLDELTDDEKILFAHEFQELSECAESLRLRLESLNRAPPALIWAFVDNRKVDALLSKVQRAYDAFALKFILLGIEKWGALRQDTNTFNTRPLMWSGPRNNDYLNPNISQNTVPTPGLFVECIARREYPGSAEVLRLDDKEFPRNVELLLGSDIRIARASDGGFFIVEERRYLGEIERQAALRRISEVASTLHQGNVELRDYMSRQTRIAQCVGFRGDPRTRKLQLLFRTSRRTQTIHSLRALLLNNSPGYTLNERIELAQMVTTAVFYTHSYRYVHKNIRPSTIVCITEQGNFEIEAESNLNGAQSRSFLPRKLGTPLLVGYGDARIESASSRRTKEEHLFEEVYCHPSRRGSTPAKKHTFLHDIYSLGVVLIEIGLWNSFWVPNDDPSNWAPSHKDDADDWVPNKKAYPEFDPNKLSPHDMQKWFEAVARDALPRKVGQRYADVVIKCLTGFDRGSEDATREGIGKDMQDGFDYVDQILRQLFEITV